MTEGKHYQVIMQHFSPELGLEKEEFFSFNIVSGMVAGTLIPDETEKKMAAAFIANIINDKISNARINTAMDKILAQRDVEDPLYTVAMYMIEIMFHTRWLTDYKTILDKARIGHKIVLEGGSLNHDQKLTLREYAFVRDLAALQQITDKLEQIQLVDSIEEVYQGILRCNQTIRDIELKMKIDHAKQPFFPIQKQRLFYEKLLNYFAHLTHVFVQKSIPSQKKPGPGGG